MDTILNSPAAKFTLNPKAAPKQASREFLEFLAEAFTSATAESVTLTGQMEAELHAVRVKYEARLAEADKRRATSYELMKKHSVKFRDDLFPQSGEGRAKVRKSIQLLHGMAGFAWNPWKVEKLEGVKQTLTELKRLAVAAMRRLPEWKKYVRVEYSLKADLILSDFREGTLTNEQLEEFSLQIQRSEAFEFKPEESNSPARA